MKVAKQFGIASMLVCVGVTVATAFAFSDPSKDDQRRLKAIREYQSWPQMTTEPELMSRKLDLLCRRPTKADYKAYDKDPHFKKYIRVFVNKQGEKAMQEGKPLPEGSIVVKEKRRGLDGKIELFTVMIKREKGYNPECGDWEFAVVDGGLGKFEAKGKLQSCMSCHTSEKKLDFTYRTYMNAFKRAVPPFSD